MYKYFHNLHEVQIIGEFPLTYDTANENITGRNICNDDHIYIYSVDLLKLIKSGRSLLQSCLQRVTKRSK
jgi:hypothetical protein